MQFFGRHAGQAFRCCFVNGAAVYRAQEIIQQTLPRGSVVKYFTNKGGLGCFLDKILQACGRGIESFEEE